MHANKSPSQPDLDQKAAGSENQVQHAGVLADDVIYQSQCTSSEAALHRNRDRHVDVDDDKIGEASSKIEVAGASEPPPSNGKQADLHQAQEDIKKTKGQNLCLHYIKNMGCQKGASCLKVHSDEEREVRAQRRASTQCQFFLRGSCNRGDKCDYWHDQAALEEIRQVKKPDKENKTKVGIKDEPPKQQPIVKTSASTPIGAKAQSVKKPNDDVDCETATAMTDHPPGNFSPKANAPKGRGAPSLIPNATAKAGQEDPSASKRSHPSRDQRVQSGSKDEPEHAAKKARLTSPSEETNHEASEVKLTCYGKQSARFARLENMQDDLQLYRCEKAVHFTVSPDKELTAVFVMICPNGHHMTESRDEDPHTCTGCQKRIKGGDRFYFCVCGHIFGGRCSIRPYHPK
jgi:hypothetical protein